MLGAYEEGLLILIGINTLLGLSVYVILATGQLSLGNAAFMAVGAYLTAVLTVNAGVPLIVALAVAGLVAGVLGVAVGFPALRFGGIYLAMATLAFGELVRTFFLNFKPTGGTQGFYGMEGINTWLLLVCVAVLLALVLALERSPVWLKFRAVNDDEVAARMAGVRTTLVRTGAFGFGGFLAAVGGGLFAQHTLYIEPGNFGWLTSIDMVLIVILGGSRTAWGPLAGAVVVTVLPEMLRFMASWREAMFGALLVAMLLVRRQGLLSRGMMRSVLRALRPTRAGEPAVASPPVGATAGASPEPTTDTGAAGEGEPLRLDSVTKSFGGLLALDRVSLDVQQGDIIGLIGPNGAGKTTVFNVLTNLVPPDGGSVLLGDKRLTGLRAHQTARTGMARTFQNIRLFESMTVAEQVRVARRGSDGQHGGAVHADIDNILQLTGLWEARDQLASSLPYGLQRRVEIARALALNPSVLLLDEPVAGMNPAESAELRELLSTLRDRGLTILLIEHDMPFVMSLCDRIFVLNFGSLIAQGTPSEIRHDPVVLNAYLGNDEPGKDSERNAQTA